MKIFLVAGARPNFIKIAPMVRAISNKNSESLEYCIIHTGQHYDYEMSQAFFEDLEIPKPDFFLDAGSGSHAEQTAKIMVAFEKACLTDRPDIVVVVGDVNSTLACSIVAKKLLIKVAHVEAGLRSFDLSMPEEINRMVTDSISDYFFVTEKQATHNLLNEGVDKQKIHFVGHVMIDNLLYQKQKLETQDVTLFETYSVKKELGKYIFLTMHRPSNVDDKNVLSGLVDALNEISQDFPIIFPVHPRTDKMVKEFGITLSANIHQRRPFGFNESLFLWKDAQCVITDSGGLQEETTALGVPCFTIRENTERPITVEQGTNILVGSSGKNLMKAFEKFTAGHTKQGQVPELWDGNAADRILNVLATGQ